METATGSKCEASHEYNGWRGLGRWTVYQIGERRYTVCAHQEEHGYCGALIDVTDLPQVVICCGQH